MGLIDLLELVLVTSPVRMVLLCEVLEGLGYVRAGGLFVHTQNVIVILHLFNCILELRYVNACQGSVPWPRW